MQNFLIDILFFGAILSSILVITSKNPVIAVIFLISLFVNVAVYLIVLGIGFIGISYIIVYCGAITILFLFVIMMINIKLTDILEAGSQYTKNLPLGFCVAAFFLYEIYNILPFTLNDVSSGGLNDLIIYITGLLTSLNYMFSLFLDNIVPSSVFDSNILSISIDKFYPSDNIYITDMPLNVQNSFLDLLQIETIGHSLYTYGAIWLLISSIILLLALLSPIMISKIKSNNKN